jgi:hypothetical protein
LGCRAQREPPIPCPWFLVPPGPRTSHHMERPTSCPSQL